MIGKAILMYQADVPSEEPQLYLCDDWIHPVEVLKKPGAL